MERCRHLKPARTAVSKVDIGRKELAALTESAETHGRPFDIESE